MPRKPLLKYIQNAFYILKHEGPQAFSRKILQFLLRDKIYQIWWFKNRPHQRDFTCAKKEIQRFKYKPLVSIIVPVYNPPGRFLKAAIESVLNQSYPHFELCICDDASTDPKIHALLKNYQKHPAVKLTTHVKNQGIVGASNSALKIAHGEYVAFLDHDDLLSPLALYEVARALQKKRFDLIYTDEDKISPRGFHHTPFFKPNWSPDLLKSIMYLGHLCIYCRALVTKADGLRPGFEGSQDHDLALRITAQIPLKSASQKIHHIPKVLYHWRQISASTATQISAKPYALKSAKKALKYSLKRRKIDANIKDGIWPGSYRVQYQIKDHPLVSIIIPFKDQIEHLKRCLKSIQHQTHYSNFEIILINNQSREKNTHAYLKTLKNIQILNYNQSFNFSKLNNFAAEKAKGDYLLFLNNDVEIISPEWLEALLEHAQRPEIATVGAKLLYPDQTIQHAGIVMGIAGTCSHAFRHVSDFTHGYLGQLDVIRNVSAVTGACLMISRAKFNELKGFDQQFEIAYQDVDLCLRALKKGYLNVYTPFARLYHFEGKTRSKSNQPAPIPIADTCLLLKKWSSFIQAGDPYYNPNLTLKKEDYGLA